MSRTAEIDFDNCVDETDEAVCIIVYGEKVWIPRSVIVDGVPLQDEGPGTVEVQEWFAVRKELI